MIIKRLKYYWKRIHAEDSKGVRSNINYNLFEFLLIYIDLIELLLKLN